MRINTAYTLFGLLSVCLAGAAITSCRGIEPITPSTGNEVTGGSEAGEVKGFFLLNEGNMGSNKATLDYFDYATGVYTRNIFAERNPGVALELGDVGNDLGIYGGTSRRYPCPTAGTSPSTVATPTSAPTQGQ